MTRLNDWSDRLLRIAAVLLMLGLVASVVLGVVSRLAKHPFSWTEEMAQYLLVWLGFAGWIIAGRRRSHIRILMLADLLKGVPRVALELLTQAAVALMGAAIIWYSFTLIARNLDVEAISVPFPSAALYVPLPVLGIALILQAVADATSFLRGEGIAGGGKPL